MRNSAPPTGQRSNAQLLKVVSALNVATRSAVRMAETMKHTEARYREKKAVLTALCLMSIVES